MDRNVPRQRQPREGVRQFPFPKFVFDRESTKDFGGMIIDRRPKKVSKPVGRKFIVDPASGATRKNVE